MIKRYSRKELTDIWSEENKHWMETHNIEWVDQARTFSYELIPVVSLMGSIAASEAIKLVTNKYSPINQWFTWFDSSLLPIYLTPLPLVL